MEHHPNSICYFCEEEIEFSVHQNSSVENPFGSPENQKKIPKWRHVSTGNAACTTVATPSNVFVD